MPSSIRRRWSRGGKRREDYRDFEAPPRDTVREFYRLNHRHQTWDFVQDKKAEYLTLDRAELSAWEALEFLNTLVDDSDPDLDLSQLDHLLQTAEAIRADGHPDWFVLAGLVHDLGKVLCLWGEPQWAVVGDTFPVGCAFSERIVYPELFEGNPDTAHPTYSTPLGMYEPGCGLDQVHLSWGHDEYLYQVLGDYLPEPALYMIRYHSFYACHREGAYQELMERPRPRDVRLGAALQRLRPVLQERPSAGCRRTAAVLPGADRQATCRRS